MVLKGYTKVILGKFEFCEEYKNDIYKHMLYIKYINKYTPTIYTYTYHTLYKYVNRQLRAKIKHSFWSRVKGNI